MRDAAKGVKSAFSFHPLTPGRWGDFEDLFGPRGACAGCWCLWWRLTRSEFVKGQGEANRQAMHFLVRRGEIPGLLAYDGTEAVGWCSIGPRETYPALERSRTLKRVDDLPVWSLTCFFVRRGYRRSGMTVRLLRAALDFARSNGARIVEAYPILPRSENVPVLYAYTGFASTFLKAGFVEAARRSETRPIVRKKLRATRRSETAARKSPMAAPRSG